MVSVVDSGAEGLESMEAGDVAGPGKDGGDAGDRVGEAVADVGGVEESLRPVPRTERGGNEKRSDVVEEGEVDPFASCVLGMGVGRREAVADAFGREKGGERFSDELLGVRAGDAKRTKRTM
jgi:hypothetical protein